MNAPATKVLILEVTGRFDELRPWCPSFRRAVNLR